MHDIAAQLILKWARKGPEYKIPVTSDFTRLTLDTIALCAMDYRFNSFYDNNMHPMVIVDPGAASRARLTRQDSYSRLPLLDEHLDVAGTNDRPEK